MELTLIGIALVAGIGIGYAIALFTQKPVPAAAAKGKAAAAPKRNWWEERKALTVTQAQILQHMEATKKASITELQEKFSFIPDRELFYRLEQICLMGFMGRQRKDGEVIYALNKEYAETVEEDKTVMLS